MPILCLHVLSFKLISLIYILLNNKSLVYLAAWHVIFDVPGGWRVLYLIVGVSLSLLLYRIYDIIKGKIVMLVERKRLSSWPD